MTQHPPEKLWEIYQKLPQDLKDAIFSVENATTIASIGKRNGLKEEEISILAEEIGNVLLGLLNPNEFETKIKEELKLEENIAKAINWEVNRLIFFPVKESLEKIYGIELERKHKLPYELMKPSIEKKGKEIKKDPYREPIE